ncbi:MAG: PilZ domain-containing protein [Acidobacteria bacterium]|nr:PilZ domain-containing protein [Acidobacteriota bacterium]
MPDKNKTERRSSDRFPIEREVRYRILSKRDAVETGLGRTVNMSSSGVLFTTEQALSPGRRLEVAVSWPAQLDAKCPLKLVARGKVVRCPEGQAAIEIQQYEFRTAGANSLRS